MQAELELGATSREQRMYFRAELIRVGGCCLRMKLSKKLREARKVMRWSDNSAIGHNSGQPVNLVQSALRIGVGEVPTIGVSKLGLEYGKQRIKQDWTKKSLTLRCRRPVTSA